MGKRLRQDRRFAVVGPRSIAGRSLLFIYHASAVYISCGAVAAHSAEQSRQHRRRSPLVSSGARRSRVRVRVRVRTRRETAEEGREAHGSQRKLTAHFGGDSAGNAQGQRGLRRVVAAHPGNRPKLPANQRPPTAPSDGGYSHEEARGLGATSQPSAASFQCRLALLRLASPTTGGLRKGQRQSPPIWPCWTGNSSSACEVVTASSYGTWSDFARPHGALALAALFSRSDRATVCDSSTSSPPFLSAVGEPGSLAPTATSSPSLALDRHIDSTFDGAGGGKGVGGKVGSRRHPATGHKN